MKRFYFLIFIAVQINLNGQMTSEVFQINNFEFSIRSDGKVFSSVDGSPGLTFLDSKTPLHNGLGFTISGVDPGGNVKFNSQVETLANSETLGFISGLDDWSGTNDIPIHFLDYYVVTREEIFAHIEDYNDNGIIDNPISSIFEWPGEKNKFIEEKYGYEANIIYVPFDDLNGNQIYEPEKGEYPTVKNGVHIIPEKIILKFFVSNHNSNVSGLTITQVNCSVIVYAFDCYNDFHDLNNSIFVDYTFANKATEETNKAKIGFSSNYSLGSDNNDYLAYDTTRHTSFCYNDPTKLETFSDANNLILSQFLFSRILDSDLWQIGEFPFVDPKFFNHYDLDTSSNTGGPRTHSELDKGLLSGYWNDGSLRRQSGYGYGDDSLDQAFYSFDGHIGSPDGWNEISSENPSGQRNAIQVYPPIRFQPGATSQSSFVFNYEKTENGLPDYERAEKLSFLYSGMDRFINTGTQVWDWDFDCNYPPLGTKTPKYEGESYVYPNPTNTSITIVGFDDIIRITNSIGKLIYNGYSKEKIDVSQFSAGLYMIIDDTGHSSKFIKM